jgi:hypothetical protein
VKDANMTPTKGFVVPAGRGNTSNYRTTGRSFALKLLGRETGKSIMIFEATLPAGTTSLYHLHRDSDEVAWMLASEFTFKEFRSFLSRRGPSGEPDNRMAVTSW